MLDIPTKEIKLVLEKIPLSQHVEVADTIFENCRQAAFEFYRGNRLWCTKFSTTDKPNDPKLFQLADGGFPQRALDLELRSWISKIQYACGRRLNQDDGVSVGAIRDLYAKMEGYPQYEAANILRMLYPWGLLNALEFEVSVCHAIAWCRQLYAWDCAARLE